MTLTTYVEGVLARGNALLAAEALVSADAAARQERYVERILEFGRALSVEPIDADAAALARFRAEVMRDDKGATFWRGLKDLAERRAAALDGERRRRLAVLGVEPDLFGPLDYTRAETCFTRVVAWALSPARLLEAEPVGGLGTAPLLALLAWLRARAEIPTWSDAELVTITAVPELHLEEAGRLDVALMLPGLALGIEAKVDATEGEDQLARYRSALAQSGDPVVMMFLTKDRDEPETDKDAIPISFRDLLRLWLPVAAAGESGQHLYFCRYLKSVANLYNYVSTGSFQRWGVVTQLRALDLLTLESPA